MTAPRRDPVALTVQERGRAASQQELTTATTLLAAIGMLTQCGRANRIRGASSRYASHPAHSERASPSQPRGTARSHHAANARSWLDKELRSRGHQRPRRDTTAMPAPPSAVPAHVLCEPTLGAPPTTCCPAGPKQNTSSDRRSPWINHCRRFNRRAGMVAGRVVRVKGAIKLAQDELEAGLRAATSGVLLRFCFF